MDGINEFGISLVQSDIARKVLEVRLGWIETCDATETLNLFTGVTTSVRTQRMTDTMDISWINTKFSLQCVK